MPIIAPIPQNECQKMRKLIHKTRDKNYSRRLTALLMLNEGLTVTYVAKTLHAARSSVNRWVEWFTLYGLEGPKSLPAGRPAVWELTPLYNLLLFLLQQSPQEFGYLRSRWSLELMTHTFNE